MRQELTEGQRVLMGELLPVSSYAPPPPQDPVQVHVHVGGNSGGNTASCFSWLGMVGAATVGILVYSLYQGQAVSITVGRIETAVMAAAIPQWMDNLKNWWDGKMAMPSVPASPPTPANPVSESKPRVF